MFYSDFRSFAKGLEFVDLLQDKISFKQIIA